MSLEEVLEENRVLRERISLLENQLRFKDRIIGDFRGLVSTCVEVVNHKDAMLDRASEDLGRVLGRDIKY